LAPVGSAGFYSGGGAFMGSAVSVSPARILRLSARHLNQVGQGRLAKRDGGFAELGERGSNHRANKAAPEPQAQAASPEEIQADARQRPEPKKARSRTRAGGKKNRPPAKKDRLVELLRREDGATIEELMAEFGWQAHTVRGAISIAAKRLGVTAERVRRDATGCPPPDLGGWCSRRPLGWVPGGHLAFIGPSGPLDLSGPCFRRFDGSRAAPGATQPTYGVGWHARGRQASYGPRWGRVAHTSV
jgi:hypothetical protein